jgi:hypothetical protein
MVAFPWTFSVFNNMLVRCFLIIQPKQMVKNQLTGTYDAVPAVARAYE